MNNKLISIIIPCYNCERWLPRLFNSLIQQTNKNFEVIFVNDGSKDNSLKVAYRILSKSNLNYKIINQVNLGVSVARNIGIENSTGRYLYFLDADDCVEVNFCEIVLNEVKNKDYDIMFFNFDIDKGKQVIRCENNSLLSKDTKEVLIHLLDGRLNYHICAFIVKRDIINKNNISFTPNCKYGEDNEFIIKSLCNCNSVNIVNKTIFHYLMQGDSAVHKFSLNRLDSIYAAKRSEEYIINIFNESKIRELSKQYVANKLMYNLYEFIKISNLDDKDMKIVRNKLLKVIKQNKNYLQYLNCKQSIYKRKLVYLIFSNINLYYRFLLFKKKKISNV